jgi:hypothetical protein
MAPISPKRIEDDSNWKAKRLGFTIDRATALLGDLTPFVNEAKIFLQASYL